MIGFLGEIMFQVSDKTVLTLENWKWSGSARYEVHPRHGYHALTEYTGMDPDEITFDMTLLAELGVDPMREVAKLWKYEREGIAVPLTVGTHGYGKYRWNVTNHEMTIKYTDTNGNLLGAVVSVTLQEYLNV